MHWPERCVPDDPRLADAIEASRAFLPDVVVHEVLRHVAGRRITVAARWDDNTVIVKVFHGPRARGNHRRLTALARAGVGDLVPWSLGHDPSGHVGVVGFRPGEILERVDRTTFLDTCGAAGRALHRLHGCAAQLDREWTLDDEVEQLRRRTPARLMPVIDALLPGLRGPGHGPLVPSHRDCHPRQLVADGDTVSWIDLDDCAMAPRGLDVGNMLAHLRREAIVGRRQRSEVDEARSAFLSGYAHPVLHDDLVRWEVLALLRLAGLAETRHDDVGQRDALLAELGTMRAAA